MTKTIPIAFVWNMTEFKGTKAVFLWVLYLKKHVFKMYRFTDMLSLDSNHVMLCTHNYKYFFVMKLY